MPIVRSDAAPSVCFIYFCLDEVAFSTSLKLTYCSKVSKICNIFERTLLCSTSLHLFAQKYSKYCDILLQFNDKAEFLASLLQCHMILQKSF